MYFLLQEKQTMCVENGYVRPVRGHLQVIITVICIVVKGQNQDSHHITFNFECIETGNHVSNFVVAQTVISVQIIHWIHTPLATTVVNVLKTSKGQEGRRWQREDVKGTRGQEMAAGRWHLTTSCWQ